MGGWELPWLWLVGWVRLGIAGNSCDVWPTWVFGALGLGLQHSGFVFGDLHLHL